MQKPIHISHSSSSNDIDTIRQFSARRRRHHSSSSKVMPEDSQHELSISDLKLNLPRRKRIGTTGSLMLDSSSSRTDTTVNESFNHSSSVGCNAFVQRITARRGEMVSYQFDTSESNNQHLPRRSLSISDIGMSDSSCTSFGSISSSASTTSSRLRNLDSIRSRRSDPATKRWREQCSQLYKEHIFLDPCPEQQQQQQQQQDKYAAATMKEVAALIIQSRIRSYLRNRVESRK